MEDSQWLKISLLPINSKEKDQQYAAIDIA
jgi:hypothetical protein